MNARPLALAAASAALAVTVSACGSDSKGAGSSTAPETELSATPLAEATGTPAADAKTIAITLQGDTVSPTGTGVEVTKNQPIVLEITADKAGELHVHSSPEKHIDFPAGQSRVMLTIDQPGVVDIEDHALDKLIVQLEVR